MSLTSDLSLESGRSLWEGKLIQFRPRFDPGKESVKKEDLHWIRTKFRTPVMPTRTGPIHVQSLVLGPHQNQMALVNH